MAAAYAGFGISRNDASLHEFTQALSLFHPLPIYLAGMVERVIKPLCAIACAPTVDITPRVSLSTPVPVLKECAKAVEGAYNSALKIMSIMSFDVCGEQKHSIQACLSGR